MLGALALLAGSAWVLQRAKQVPTAPASAAEAARKQRYGRVFGWVNAAQWGAIFLLGWLLPRLGYGQDVVPAVVLVVGLHLFPLARLFADPVQQVTGVRG